MREENLFSSTQSMCALHTTYHGFLCIQADSHLCKCIRGKAKKGFKSTCYTQTFFKGFCIKTKKPYHNLWPLNNTICDLLFLFLPFCESRVWCKKTWQNSGSEIGDANIHISHFHGLCLWGTNLTDELDIEYIVNKYVYIPDYLATY